MNDETVKYFQFFSIDLFSFSFLNKQFLKQNMQISCTIMKNITDYTEVDWDGRSSCFGSTIFCRTQT